MIALVAKEATWESLLVDGYEPVRRAQRMFRHLPSGPRCKLCQNPFHGIGGKLVGLAGFKPSRKNPNLCSKCCDGLPAGGLEVDIAVVFADVRGSTGLGEAMSPTEFAARLNRFYKTATDVLVRHDAIIDKLIGDEVMALFIRGFAGDDYRRDGALAAIDLSRSVSEVPIGVAVNAGTAFVGNVGSGFVVDFTALGDAVNVAARLQSFAAVGEVVVAADLYELIEREHPGARRQRVEVRGREEPMDIAVLSP
jgi:adenylate cyclase